MYAREKKKRSGVSKLTKFGAEDSYTLCQFGGLFYDFDK